MGWIRPVDDEWVAVSLLGRDVSGASDWTAAEQALEQLGIGWLAGVWQLDRPAGPERVRIVRVAVDGITVHADHFGAPDVSVERFELPWPAPAELRPPGESASSPAP